MGQSIDLAGAVEHALRAPSVHNTQPWRWRIRPDQVELHADLTRHLPWTDPERRDLLLSCGAALHHLRVALAARGASVQVDRLPDPENSTHLATVTLVPGEPDQEAAALFPAINRRRTDRRRMSQRAVPWRLIQTCIERAQREGVDLLPATSPSARKQLAAAIALGAAEQAISPGYAAELHMWTSRYAASRDGVPEANVAPPPIGLAGPSPLRRFPRAALAQPPRHEENQAADDAAELLILITPSDDELTRLRAGEAASAVLLSATLAGLATTPLSQAVEVHGSRRELRRRVLGGPEYPQLIIRVGWPAAPIECVPLTPRRTLNLVTLSGG